MGKAWFTSGGLTLNYKRSRGVKSSAQSPQEWFPPILRVLKRDPRACIGSCRKVLGKSSRGGGGVLLQKKDLHILFKGTYSYMLFASFSTCGTWPVTCNRELWFKQAEGCSRPGEGGLLLFLLGCLCLAGPHSPSHIHSASFLRCLWWEIPVPTHR